ncbi:hypothetical protein HY768_10740 [candidate division TA06 bacterium]|uniref:Uncharacterized protein n=1 Tax=candidate division TA06 bacterium TaxID=2250710 RepID=A0A933IE24_UNCT6|nr:hypothetical protein [candidate division TA06 bacterium]
MQKLDNNQTADFIAFTLSKIETTGFVSPLKEYAQTNSENVSGRAVDSLYQNLCQGMCFRDAFLAMQIRFPALVEEILVTAIEQSILDYALAEMDKIFKTSDSDSERLTALHCLRDKYNSSSKTETICHGCLIREFENILKRVETENACEIIFEQDGEKYFKQTYIGPKVVKYTEPCHSKTYKTLLAHLKEISGQSKPIDLNGKKYTAKKIEENKFKLVREQACLSMTFK